MIQTVYIFYIYAEERINTAALCTYHFICFPFLKAAQSVSQCPTPRPVTTKTVLDGNVCPGVASSCPVLGSVLCRGSVTSLILAPPRAKARGPGASRSRSRSGGGGWGRGADAEMLCPATASAPGVAEPAVNFSLTWSLSILAGAIPICAPSLAPWGPAHVRLRPQATCLIRLFQAPYCSSALLMKHPSDGGIWGRKVG